MTKRYIHENDINYDYIDIDLDNQPNILISKATTTMSSILGSVICIVKDHLIYRFPKNFLKSIYVDTKLLSQDQGNDKDGIYKLSNPKLTIQVNFDAQQDLYYTAPMNDWQRSFRYIFKKTQKNYQTVFDDTENNNYIFGIPDRAKFMFDIKVQCDTKMQLMNLTYYIKQSFDTHGYYYLNRMPIEVEIPKTYLELIKRKMEFKTETPDEIEKFNNYLQKYSLHQIQCKINRSTGKYSYYFKSYANMLCKLEDLTTESSRTNQVDSDIFVSFRLSTELWIPGAFALEIKQKVSDDDINDLENSIASDGDRAEIILNYSTINPDKMDGDKKLIIWKSYVTDINVEVDILDLRQVLGKQLLEVIDYNNKHNINNLNIFSIKIYAKNSQLNPEKDFKVDWEKLEISTINPMNYMTYNVSFYADTAELNKTLNILGY